MTDRARHDGARRGDRAELSILLRQNKTVLEVRDFQSGEFEPLPLETLLAVLKAREAQRSIRLVPRR